MILFWKTFVPTLISRSDILISVSFPLIEPNIELLLDPGRTLYKKAPADGSVTVIMPEGLVTTFDIGLF